MNILEEIMKSGVLVEPKAAERISKMGESELAEIMERIKKEKPLVLSEDFFGNFIEVTEIQPLKKLSVQDYAAQINNYFNVLQSLFEKRNKAVSISNASGSAAVIGLVKNILPDGFELEDSTGSIKILSKAQVEEDDVVMVTGKTINKALYADLVEFPDIPERQVRKSPKKCEIIFGAQAEDCDYSVLFGEIFSMGKKLLVAGKNPVQAKINNILILIFGCAKNIPHLQILKKRRLPGTLFAIAEVPDIFLLRGSNLIENYKNTTIVAINDKSIARINLMTMEAKLEEI